MGNHKPPKLKRCPECGKITGAERIWGYPIDEAFEWEKQGLVLLMGCEPGPPADEPGYKFQCTSCGHQWGGIPFKDFPDKDEMLKVVDEFIKNHGQDCFMKLLGRCGRKEIVPLFLRLLCYGHQHPPRPAKGTNGL